MSDAIRRGIVEAANALGIDPIDLATTISYETKGTFNPTIGGPVTQHGRHRGLIQFGEPQARADGVNWNDPVRSQLGAGGAIVKYLRQAGVKPGMGLRQIYSAINAGHVGLGNRTDANNGGAAGTVDEKVAGMGDHRQNAIRFMGGAGSSHSNFSQSDTGPVADGYTNAFEEFANKLGLPPTKATFDRLDAQFQPKNAAIVPHQANTDRDVASRDTTSMNPNDLIARMMAAGGRQSTNVEDQRTSQPSASDPAQDLGQNPQQMQDDQKYQACVERWIQENGRDPATDSDFAEIDNMMSGKDYGKDTTQADVLKKMGVDGDGADSEGAGDQDGPQPAGPDDSMGGVNFDPNDPAVQAAIQQWSQANGGKQPATDSDFAAIEQMIASVKPTGPVAPPQPQGVPQQGGPSMDKQMMQQQILEKMLGGANR